ncbi:MAG TPA: hypothetical protein VEV84_03320 [Pyrinomonadaceae bacterium]|nr:hypothetical protein [Pyrinomonadaceae bacterium]
MREVVFILIVIAVLLALTAIKYRRQIVTLITFWKQFQAARARLQQSANTQRPIESDRGIGLVNCARCGKWIPENEARRHSPTTFICVNGCLSKAGVG